LRGRNGRRHGRYVLRTCGAGALARARAVSCRLQEITSDVADAVAGNVIDKELDLLEVDEATALVLGDQAEKLQNLFRGGSANTSAFAGVGGSEADFIAFGKSCQDGHRFGLPALFVQVAEVIERVDDCGVECIVLLRGRAPEEERIEVEGNVFVKEGDSEVSLGLRKKDAVVIG